MTPRPFALPGYPSARTAGCPSGQRERSVKPPAQPTLVRTQHLPPSVEARVRAGLDLGLAPRPSGSRPFVEPSKASPRSAAERETSRPGLNVSRPTLGKPRVND